MSARLLVVDDERLGIPSIIGESPQMLHVKSLIRKVARSDASSALLFGEKGSGKEFLARMIHHESRRAEKPFASIACGAFPERLLESELFGHEKGSFADAKAQKKGLFESADEGTVYFDEVAEMTAALQTRLLRVLEEKAFRRLGGATDITVDVRVIAGANRDLLPGVEQKTFREDLFYRLNVMPIYVPPLRDRSEDIPLLADHFLKLCAVDAHRGPKQLSTQALEKLRTYDWPGNLGELRSAIERAVLLSTDEIVTVEDVVLGGAVPGDKSGERHAVRLPIAGCKLSEIEKDLVRQALRRSNWNQTRAAALLGISRDQMRYKMTKFGLKRG
ncbi:MAG: sigma-54-dependent Fis family transcriptional regulator [Candidatus Hydrogenedentes bacterium]|nr:sigma-54-dependent Fis family transcriptional regulator [Candidatus Hydrogenedentota bacterium]